MAENLIVQIARCDEIEKAMTNENHPCRKIVEYQNKELDITDFRLPEPFNGDISTAEILFVSSNPSIDKDEPYPTGDWNDGDITRFFTDRFENTPKEKHSRYWKFIFKWATWLLPDIAEAEIHKHIAITEIVHCKSKSEKDGVKDACCFCTGKWLNKVLEQFKGEYIVVVGNTAKACFGCRDVNAQVIFTKAPRAQSNDERKKEFSKYIK